jgi:hypothetical protein
MMGIKNKRFVGKIGRLLSGTICIEINRAIIVN